MAKSLYEKIEAFLGPPRAEGMTPAEIMDEMQRIKTEDYRETHPEAQDRGERS